MTYLYNFIVGLACAIGFAVLFNVPRNSIVKTGIAGGIGWVIYILFNTITDSTVLSTFVASATIALIGEIFAIKFKNPATVYIVPAIVPLVPGHGLYYTMLSIIEKDYEAAAKYGGESILISVAIAGALTIILSINNFRKVKKSQRLN